MLQSFKELGSWLASYETAGPFKVSVLIPLTRVSDPGPSRHIPTSVDVEMGRRSQPPQSAGDPSFTDSRIAARCGPLMRLVCLSKTSHTF
jgi:hypothetical protein